ncbi:3-hydroxypropanoate dehydrogenase [Lipingzhangella halophila]|uniref:3-hydroxypropanoate dehydrogenase n=1 Tax=Lipingzhangella halophila TaxID=1783352 RepID=A0A7W7RJ73_9ACTN|nr:malonic semialdehyde reductase [Lipingzhangella halophila]MBB4932915.1 3-hydroxypropanoate dehydrogenase [Lipingzhangella halophila]
MTNTTALERAQPVIDDPTADRLFRAARTTMEWADAEVPDERIQAAWDLTKFGPTAMNCLPMRMAVVRTPEAKARLIPHMAEANQAKVEAAPLSLVLAGDPSFHEHMPTTFPVVPDMKDQLDPVEDVRGEMARTNALLQAGYLIIALRSVGLAAGPMNGMDFQGVDGEFFADSGFKSFLVVNTGVAEGAGTPFPRLPRLDLHQVAQVL